MSKRKPETISKHARSPKSAAKAQRTTRPVSRGPKDNRDRSIAAGVSESLKHLEVGAKKDALLAVKHVTALKDDRQQTMIQKLNQGFGFAFTPANLRAYQSKLLEMAQADIQFAFEVSQRLATIRSPVELPGVIAEFTSRRISMFRKYSKELVELSTKRLTPSGDSASVQ